MKTKIVSIIKRIKSFPFLLVLAAFSYGCCDKGIALFNNCCDDKTVTSSTFTEVEKQLIPYISMDNSYFLDENGTSVRASIQNSEFNDGSIAIGEECFDIHEYQIKKGKIYFFSKNLAFDLKIDNAWSTTASMTITERVLNKVNNGYSTVEENVFKVECAKLQSDSLELHLTDTIIFDYNFQNTLIFDNCNQTSYAVPAVLMSNLIFYNGLALFVSSGLTMHGQYVMILNASA